ncbi:hypothetical protein V8Z69_00895 [Microbacterium aurugineum]|uniref:hypothetical protein n=1 Tax=Microbacterium aurugineum TaxID=2851642 RepID=UPI0039BDDB80
MNDTADGYRLRLRALQQATEELNGLRDTNDAEEAAIAAHRALDAVYDLHEAYFRAVGIFRPLAARDDHLTTLGGQVVGALAFARDAKTHDIITASRSAGLGELPFGAGPFGGGWVWREHASDEPRFQTRAGWYRSLVQWKRLAAPLEDAYDFFADNEPA